MANLLDLLWDLVERPSERDEYLKDPSGYVRAHGRADLTSEDVGAALELVCDLVPADLAAAIQAGRRSAPSSSLHGHESPLDCAIRSLSHVVASVADHLEAGPRPDPSDVGEPALGADVRIEEDHDANVFDPSDLQVGHEAPAADHVAPPESDPIDHTPFDPNTLVTGNVQPDTDTDTDRGSGSADVLKLAWADEPDAPDEPADPVEDNVFAFGPGPDETLGLDDADAELERTGGEPVETPVTAAEDQPASGTTMFKKKSNLRLPKIGVDASDWYDADDLAKTEAETDDD